MIIGLCGALPIGLQRSVVVLNSSIIIVITNYVGGIVMLFSKMIALYPYKPYEVGILVSIYIVKSLTRWDLPDLLKIMPLEDNPVSPENLCPL